MCSVATTLFPFFPQDEHVLCSSSVSERVRLWERCRGLLDAATVQRTFFNKIHRPRPPCRYTVKKALRSTIRVRGTVQVRFTGSARVEDFVALCVYKESPVKGRSVLYLFQCVK